MLLEAGNDLPKHARSPPQSHNRASVHHDDKGGTESGRLVAWNMYLHYSHFLDAKQESGEWYGSVVNPEPNPTRKTKRKNVENMTKKNQSYPLGEPNAPSGFRTKR